MQTSYVRQLLAVWYATQPEIRPNLEAALSSSYVRAVAPPSLWAHLTRAASTMPVGSMDAVRNWFLLYSPSSTVFSPPLQQRGSFRWPPPPAPQPSPPPSPPGWAERPACAVIRHGLQAPVCLNTPWDTCANVAVVTCLAAPLLQPPRHSQRHPLRTVRHGLCAQRRRHGAVCAAADSARCSQGAKQVCRMSGLPLLKGRTADCLPLPPCAACVPAASK